MDVSGGAIIVVIVVSIVVGGGLVFALLRAATLKDPALVVTSVSLLTMTALVAYAITDLEVLGGLAGVGLGSLAGAIAGLYKGPKD